MHERLQGWQQAVSWEEMLWALSTCRSRGFGGPFPGMRCITLSCLPPIGQLTPVYV